MTIMITGATGTVGRSLASELATAGARVRALVRNPERARQLLPAGVELVVGDFADPASLRAAVAGVSRLFLAAPNHPDQVDWECAVIDACRNAGVARVVKLSAHGARLGSEVAFWDAHARIEQYLADSGLDAVVLRPTTYASTLLAGLDGPVLIAPAAGARVSFIDPADVAASAAALLTGGNRTDRMLTLTGPAAHTFEEAAAVLSALTGRRIGFVPVPDDAARSAMLGAGMPEWYADNVLRVFAALRSGVADLATDAVRELTGRSPRGLSDALGVLLAVEAA